MNLLYVLIMFTGPTWVGSVDLYTTPSQERCEAIQKQLSTTAKRYECHTLVSPKAAK